MADTYFCIHYAIYMHVIQSYAYNRYVYVFGSKQEKEYVKAVYCHPDIVFSITAPESNFLYRDSQDFAIPTYNKPLTSTL